MKRSELEHIIRAATTIADDHELVIAIRGPSTLERIGWCLEIQDLLVSKYVANREKDRRFARAAIRHGMVKRETLFERLEQTDLEPERRRFLGSLVALDFGESDRDGSSP
jgi:hypothetical protein